MQRGDKVGKIVLAAPHSLLSAHPQLVPALERGYCVEAFFENKLSNWRLQQLWQSRDVDVIIFYGPMVAAAQLAGLPPRKFALIFIDPPFSLPDGLSRDPMCMLLKTCSDGFQLRMWGQGEKYADLVCQLIMGLYSIVQVDFTNTNFTDKEKEVLGMLLQGLRDDYIARAMFISPKTVRNHISNMLRKVRVDSRTQLVLWALSRHLQN